MKSQLLAISAYERRVNDTTVEGSRARPLGNDEVKKDDRVKS